MHAGIRVQVLAMINVETGPEKLSVRIPRAVQKLFTFQHFASDDGRKTFYSAINVSNRVAWRALELSHSELFVLYESLQEF